MLQILGWTIAIISIGAQFYLSRRANVYWGAILPLLYVTYIVWWYFKNIDEVNTFSHIFAIVAGLAFFLSVWINGREAVKTKRKKELEKIDLQNIH